MQQTLNLRKTVFCGVNKLPSDNQQVQCEDQMGGIGPFPLGDDYFGLSELVKSSCHHAEP